MAKMKSKNKTVKTKAETKKTKKVSTKKTATKIVKKTKKKTLYQKLKKYIYPSAIFALMMTVFNYIFMIFSLYSEAFGGLYMWIFDNVTINVIFNTIFDFIFFFTTFLAYTYLLIEMVILPEK